MRCEDERAYKGDCCCNCANQARLTRHPWNSSREVGRGSVKEIFGWACLAFRDEGASTFFDKQHGICEMHTPKEKP